MPRYHLGVLSAKTQAADNSDFILTGNSCWIQVGRKRVVYILDQGGVLSAEIYRNGHEMEDPLDSCSVCNDWRPDD